MLIAHYLNGRERDRVEKENEKERESELHIYLWASHVAVCERVFHYLMAPQSFFELLEKTNFERK